MTNFSDYLQKKVLGATLLGSTYTSPACTWLGLISSMNVTDGASTTEVGGVGYQRVGISWTATTSNATQNSTLIAFAQAPATWGSVPYVGIYDAATAGTGNLLFWATLTATRYVIPGYILQWQPNKLTTVVD